jgi:hypothetical protein
VTIGRKEGKQRQKWRIINRKKARKKEEQQNTLITLKAILCISVRKTVGHEFAVSVLHDALYVISTRGTHAFSGPLAPHPAEHSLGDRTKWISFSFWQLMDFRTST